MSPHKGDTAHLGQTAIPWLKCGLLLVSCALKQLSQGRGLSEILLTLGGLRKIGEALCRSKFKIFSPHTKSGILIIKQCTSRFVVQVAGKRISNHIRSIIWSARVCETWRDQICLTYLYGIFLRPVTEIWRSQIILIMCLKSNQKLIFEPASSASVPLSTAETAN